MMDELRQKLPKASAIIREGSASVINQESLRGDPDVVARAIAALPNTSDLFPTRDEPAEIQYVLQAN